MTKRQMKENLSKRQQIRAQRIKKQRQQRLMVIMGISIVALVLAGAIIIPPLMRQNAPVGTIVTITPVLRPQVQANAMGDPNAPVKIEEFSDYQCSFCKRFADTTEPRIVEDYVKTGKVYFVYRSMGNFVSDNIRQGKTESRDSAEASYCAGDQNKFWEYKDMLYANWQGEDVGSFSENRLIAFAEAIDLDLDEFRSCMDSNKFRDQVEQDKIDGQRAGITGTPSFVINGNLAIRGAEDYSVFQREIDAALAAATQ